MQRIQLYLNDQLCDLSDDSPMALTFQINNLADVKNQSGNTSNQFKIPLTQNNRRILGFPDDIRVTNNTPYTQLKAVIIQDGIEVLPFGLCEINDSDNNNADITIISGNVDFFDQIDGQLYDMGDSTTVYGAKQPFLPYQHKWNLQTAVDSRNNTSGFIYPVIDYGNLSPLAPYTVNVRRLRPAFFLHTAIELIIAQTGYKATGSMLSDELYNKIIIPFANDTFEHGTDYQTQPDELGMLAYTNVDQTTTHYSQFDPFGKGIFHFGRIDSDPKHQFDGTTFTATEIFTGEVLVTMPSFYFKGRANNSHPSNVNVIIYLQTPDGDLQTSVFNYDLSEFTRVPGTSGGGLQGYRTFPSEKVSSEINFLPGYRVSVRWEFIGDNPQTFIMYNGASLSIKANNNDVLFGQDIQCERIFPDISQKDLLKDTLQRFGIICQSDNTTKTISFASFKDIVKNIPIAYNWTSKCVDVGKNNSFRLGDYAQINNLLYKTDDAITVTHYADDVININNKNLPATVDLFNGQFAPSLNSPYVGGFVAQVLKIDVTGDSDEFTIGTAPRILVDQKLNLFNTGSSVTFTDGTNNRVVNDVISTPYFYKLNGPFSLMWKDQDGKPGLRKLYYKELERILTQAKKVIRYFILTPRDISELDLLVPVYLEQDNAYFYINKIDSWRKGQAIKVELIKIGEI